MNWDLNNTEVHTDHKLVTVMIYHPDAPYIGSGRWYIPLHLLRDRDIAAEIDRTGRELLKKIINTEKPLENADNVSHADATETQSLYAEWKQDILKYIRNVARKKIPKLDARIDMLKTEIRNTQNNRNMPMEARQRHTAILDDEIKQLNEKRYQRARDNLDMNGWINRETIRKPWINENKERKPRDTFYRLKIPDFKPSCV